MPGSEAALDPPVLAGVRRSHAHCPGLCPDCVCSGERSSGGKETVTGPQVHRLPGEEPNRTSQAVESKYLHFCASSLPPRSAHGRVCKACNGRECSRMQTIKWLGRGHAPSRRPETKISREVMERCKTVSQRNCWGKESMMKEKAGI